MYGLVCRCRRTRNPRGTGNLTRAALKPEQFVKHVGVLLPELVVENSGEFVTRTAFAD